MTDRLSPPESWGRETPTALFKQRKRLTLSFCNSLLGVSGGAGDAFVQNAKKFPLDTIIIGVALSVTFVASNASSNLFAGVVTGYDNSQSFSPTQEGQNVLAIVSHRCGAGTQDIPVTKVFGVSFDPPFLPFLEAGLPIAAFVYDALGAGDTLSGFWTVYYSQLAS